MSALKGGEKIMKWLHMVAYLLLFVGGLNWGLVGLFQFNLVEAVFGGLSTLVYVLVGLSTVYAVATHMSDCKVCAK